jgi:putative acetyltransferase
MSGRSLPAPALRPFLPADAPVLADIFQASIEELTGEDYGEAQQAAWASLADDPEAFGSGLSENLTLVATMDGTPVGFVSVKGGDQIEMLYVHPAVGRQGIGTLLCDAVEKLAAARGVKALTTDASDTALDFFTRRGFRPQRRNTVPLGGEWLANTTMEKRLAAPAGGNDQ